MKFADSIAAQAAEHHAANITRLRKQAKNRAAANGIDQAFAESEAERLYHSGDTHEQIVTAVAGEFRRIAA